MRSPVLYFFLLVLQVSFDLAPDILSKRGRFSKILSEEGLKFVTSEGNNLVSLNLSLVLLPGEVDPILEQSGCKNDVLVARGTGHIKIIFTLPAKVVTLHI